MAYRELSNNLAQIEAGILDKTKLQRLSQESASKYQAGDPFPHVIFDDFFQVDIVKAIRDEFPELNSDKWLTYRSALELKSAMEISDGMGPLTKYFLSCLNSQPFLKFLEELTGISGLIPDPLFRGGGMHQIGNGGLLAIHADFNKHRVYRLDRRLNVLLYLNEGWEDEWGGHFEMWNRDMTECKQRVLPLFNRLVVFTTDRYSYHGHPDPLKLPPGVSRKSLALYYYTNGRPEAEDFGDHTTLFQLRPQDRDNKEMVNLVEAARSRPKKNSYFGLRPFAGKLKRKARSLF